MNRRDFIKNAIAAACVLALPKPPEYEYAMECEWQFYTTNPRYMGLLFLDNQGE